MWGLGGPWTEQSWLPVGLTEGLRVKVVSPAAAPGLDAPTQPGPVLTGQALEERGPGALQAAGIGDTRGCVWKSRDTEILVPPAAVGLGRDKPKDQYPIGTWEAS